MHCLNDECRGLCCLLISTEQKHSLICKYTAGILLCITHIINQPLFNPKTMTLDLLFLNDVHGYLEPHNELFYNNHDTYTKKVGGYARIASLIKEIRQNNKHTLLFDGGDTFHGTLPLVKSKGEAVIPILNKLNFQAMVGHWDFGYGPDQLKNILSQLSYPMLGINVYRTDGTLFLKPYTIIPVGDIKVGVVGICSNIIDKTMPKNFSEGLKITSGLDELPQNIEQMKNEGADLIILLSHNGFPQDIDILKQVDGIDVCLSAHTHNRLYESVTVNGTIVIQCGCHGSFLGHLQLEMKDKQIETHKYELLKVDNNIVPDKDVAELVSNAVKPFEEIKNNVLGTTTHTLHRYNTLNSSMDDFLLAAIKHASNTEIAFSNGWRYGAPIAPGDITEMDLYNIIPMNPPISTVELTGKEIKEMLEENLERTFSANPLDQMGGYVKRCAGLRVNFRIENPKNYRIQEIYFDDKHLELDAYYKVSFVTSQGVPPNIGRNREDLEIHAVEAMRNFLALNSQYVGTQNESFYLV